MLKFKLVWFLDVSLSAQFQMVRYSDDKICPEMECQLGQMGQNRNPNKKRLKSKLNCSDFRQLGLKSQTKPVSFGQQNLKS